MSLVSCPIQLFLAISDREKIRFHLINKKTGHRMCGLAHIQSRRHEAQNCWCSDPLGSQRSSPATCCFQLAVILSCGFRRLS